MNYFLIANLLHFYRNHQRLRNLTLTVQISDISQSFVSATKYENISIQVQCGKKKKQYSIKSYDLKFLMNTHKYLFIGLFPFLRNLLHELFIYFSKEITVF
jgi:23S rRNA G2069 N7-methylase RlmK/C1962 C5-methylase RlmI